MCETPHMPMVYDAVQEHLRAEHGVEHANFGEDIKLNQNLVASVLAQSGNPIMAYNLP
ncbi:uncharacterized protein B0H18DRAFT_1039528, partial [Fomitopsis serialis]|uniref:uncharacterized protein n=1 Tax=Fomitopsis serialis TaxID=139415 RepID=UPI002008A565